MINVALYGKKYDDIIIDIDNFERGETNTGIKQNSKLGGIYNMPNNFVKNLNFTFFEDGLKRAYIISELEKAERSSIVFDVKASTVSKRTIESINLNYDWLHVSYVDDLENFENLLDLKIDYSIDFCTSDDRSCFFDIMKSASIIFDSRERKYLYDHISIDTPIILHDKFGISILSNKEIIYDDILIPLKNINVNGAGDVFASIFLSEYDKTNLPEAATSAMKKTKLYLQETK